MIPFLLNAWSIWKSAPQVIGIVKAILDIVGSTQVQTILEMIRDILQKEVPNPAVPPATEPERKRLVQRLFKQMALKSLGMSEQDYVAFVNREGRDLA